MKQEKAALQYDRALKFCPAGQALATLGEVLTAPFTHLPAGGGTFLCLLASNMTALSSGSSTPDWGILSFTAHEEQTDNEIKPHIHLQQLKKAKHFLFAKGKSSKSICKPVSHYQPMIISYTLPMQFNCHPNKQMDFCNTENTNSLEEGSLGVWWHTELVGGE